jgi:transposase
MDQGKSIVIIHYAGISIPDISQKLGVAQCTIYYQFKKFNKRGLTDRVPVQG